MSSIRTVNLIWETKTRASYPVSRYAVSDEGIVTLAMPRPLEVRAYDLTLISKNESKQTGSGFSVETLLKVEASSGSQNAIGMTSDDLYLLVNGTKKRFLGERHNLYADSSLSRDGKLIVAGFSDMSGSSFAFAYGDISGEAHWLHELPDSISCLALSPDGVRIAIGSETGKLWMMDSGHYVTALLPDEY